MRTSIALILVLGLSPTGFGQHSQSSQSSSKEEITDRRIISLSLNRPQAKPPAITLQKALRVAENYIEKNKIDISPYYLTEIKLIAADPEKGLKEPYWWFWWVKPNGAAGDYFQLGISMKGEVQRLSSM